MVVVCVNYMEGLYEVLLPVSDRALRNIEAASNLAGLGLAVYLGLIVYRKIAGKNIS